MTLRTWLCAGLLVTSLGCTAKNPDAGPSCPDQAQQPLYNASAIESYLGLAESQQRALVAMVDETEKSALCSGTFIDGSWVLTAAHCDELVNATVVISAGAHMPSARVPVKGRKLHPTADVALFQVDFSAASFGDEHPAPDAPSLDATSFDISPLSLPSAELTRLVPGVAVELAGYGLDEQGGAGALRYLVEQVVAISHLQVTVAGFGRSGACDGDSGAPLLMRENGSLVVSGVLSGGSLGCLYEDDYLRTDADQIRAWIQGIVGTTHAGLPSSHECGSITEQGRCLYGSALWCDSGTLIAEPCGDGRACGWSSAESGYRCSALEAPCSGIDEVGECRNGQAIRCVRGKTQATSCNGCATCQVNGETGIPYCAASSG